MKKLERYYGSWQHWLLDKTYEDMPANTCSYRVKLWFAVLMFIPNVIWVLPLWIFERFLRTINFVDEEFEMGGPFISAKLLATSILNLCLYIAYCMIVMFWCIPPDKNQPGLTFLLGVLGWLLTIFGVLRALFLYFHREYKTLESKDSSSSFSRMYKAIKGKYCTPIEWTTKRGKEKFEID